MPTENVVMSAADRMDELCALLAKRSVLSRDEREALASIGIDTPEALLALARDPEQRSRVARQLDLSEGDLITAGMVARLLAIQGAGAVLARRVADETDLSSWADPEGRENIQFLLEIEPSDFLSLNFAP